MLSFIKPRYKEMFRDKKLILFDMDGTVTKTEYLNYLLYKKALDKVLKVRLNKEDWENFFSGRSSEVSLRDYLEAHNVFYDKTILQNLIEEIRASKEKRLSQMSNIELVDGFIEFVKKLRKENFKIGLVTSTTRSFVKIILSKAGIEGFFDEVVAREDCNIGKPNPDIYCYAMKIFKINPRHTIVFEDSFFGLMAAVRSKAVVIQVNNQPAKLDGVCLNVRDYLEIIT